VINDAKTCQESFCTGRMIFARKERANENGAYSTEFEIDVYACDDCGTEDWG
jgi:hypothetical protein